MLSPLTVAQGVNGRLNVEGQLTAPNVPSTDAARALRIVRGVVRVKKEAKLQGNLWSARLRIVTVPGQSGRLRHKILPTVRGRSSSDGDGNTCRQKHRGIEVGDEAFDPLLEMLLGGEVAVAEQFADQNREPDLDMVRVASSGEVY